MSYSDTPFVDSQTVLGPRPRSDDVPCGTTSGEDDNRPCKRQKTEGEAMTLTTSHDETRVTPTMNRVPSSSKLETPFTADVAYAPDTTPDALYAAANLPATYGHQPIISVHERISDAYKILTGRISLRKVDYYRARRVQEDVMRLDDCWMRYQSAVEAVGGEVADCWFLAGNRPEALAIIMEQYEDSDAMDGQHESVYWDWYPEGDAPSQEEMDQCIDEVSRVWGKLGRYKLAITTAEYAARFPQDETAPIGISQPRDIQIKVTLPPDEESTTDTQKRRTHRQDLSYLTTTDRDIHPTAIQVEDQRRREEEWLERVATMVSEAAEGGEDDDDDIDEYI
ncbi:hypothetical protein GLOTRDRAFT_95650 [Gloeophyllum trabeum ATCC 11539]|uniref:Uncharacterized protein n=1 Tax=Gloeophyllum trabeum (strain ATCC 11539 / FP-39264 / Madison 617) TaxID=670483 RepID=S7PYV3_GLOTA|nr:uncharacterized protein GLOTRDRAFT_95650 [Gloeophyllum trabeum ATCC 11539]EPQ52826.1 hypothetical protein GLOTRDRAFT_95650 [Gloeophyllum trabeum ATCC 11539]